MSATMHELLNRLKANVALLVDDTNSPLDQGLFEECAILSAQLARDRAIVIELVASLSALFPRLQQDPTPVIQLLAKLIDSLSFSDILALDPPVNFVAGLHVSAQPFNTLVLNILRKAARTTQDAAVVASMPQVIQSLVNLWLVTSDVGIASNAALVLLELLTIDQAHSEIELAQRSTFVQSTGQGLVWRRLFGDCDVYGLLFSLSSLQSNSNQSLDRRGKGVAQARVFELLPKMGALNWICLMQSHHPDLELTYNLDPTREGLLHYACKHMADTPNDVLIHTNLLQFLADLILLIRKPATMSISNYTTLSHSTSVSLNFLRKEGLHAHVLSLFLACDKSSHDLVDRNLLHGSAAHYVTIYASRYPQVLLGSGDIKDMLMRLVSVLDMAASQWSRGQVRKHDLNVLASLPRVALLPQKWLGIGRQSSPLLMIPCKNTNADALDCLATIFGGPLKPIHNNKADDTSIGHLQQEYEYEAAACYAVYVAYLHYHDTFFTDLISHADVVTLPEKAVAACKLISCIITAEFHSLPAANNFSWNEAPTHTSSLPDASTLGAILHLPSTTTPPTFTPINVNGLLISPARERLLPWLLRPREDSGRSILAKYGRRSANYKVWNAQWDVFTTFHERLVYAVELAEEESIQEKEIKAVLKAAQIRLRREDPKDWRTAGTEARVATLAG